MLKTIFVFQFDEAYISQAKLDVYDPFSNL